MPTVIPVKFRYASRDLWFDPRDTEAMEGDHVICETERGLEIGLATEDARDVSYNEFKRVCGDAPLRPVVRLATEDDLVRAEELADKGDEAMPLFRKLALEQQLDMKPVGVEYLFEGDRAVCYFSADDRIDFRQLVRDLAHELHCRIDMHQIGVREEAALVGGFGHCGQELCCARFGRQFDPVSIRMAKEQDLPLNSTKISGTCGRLMCCLRYEFEAYRDFKQRAPKRNAVIDTPLGKAKIVEYDTPKEELALRIESGKVIRVKLAEMETSEAAVKKSEELKCPCRPDTVTREALEKLNSPDVQMALAELDRENGLIEEEPFDVSDIFVNTKPRRRSRKGASGGEAGSDTEGQRQTPKRAQASADVASEGTTRKRRRRKGAQGQGTPEQDVRSVPASNTNAAAANANQASAPTRRRRRHHSTEQGEQPRGATTPANNAAKAGPSQPTRRRRPGDKGGAANASTQAALQQQKAQAQPEEGGAQAKRHRRRRHRRSDSEGK